MVDAMRRRYVTAHFADLQGLRLVPVGVAFLVSAAWRLGWLGPSLSVGRQEAGRWFFALVCIALAASFPIRASYRRRFGDVRLTGGYTGAPTLVGCLLTLILLVWHQERANWHVSLPPLFLGLVLFRLGIVQRRLRVHYVPIACAFLVLAVVAPFEMSELAGDVAVDVIVGGSLIVGGLGDDRVLRRTLQQPPSDEEAYVGAV